MQHVGEPASACGLRWPLPATVAGGTWQAWPAALGAKEVGSQWRGGHASAGVAMGCGGSSHTTTKGQRWWLPRQGMTAMA